ncbi:MAG TPA: 4'-phosphopantetheinyl transferase superfamily protein [Streptosporangiaceae bacterium]|nr:4'-phosphopantetheinyl transferase superfamily protein [Streptosporangiaceae bacterium]
MTDLVRVWIIPCDVPPEISARCTEVLDDGERARAAAFLTDRDRHQFVIAHGALRTLVGRQLNTPAEALTWMAGEHGKPQLAPPWSDLRTSLSHSASLIAVATSVHRPVGIDIQHLMLSLDTIALSARFFPPDEAGYVGAAPDARMRADRFAHLWARKEAVVKAAGGRLWPNLRIEVRDREIVRCAEPASPHRVADVPAPTAFRAAVALSGAAPFGVEVARWPDEIAESAMA